ncbi:hypothetical protein [Bradyrhizobium sp. STM 3562]|uniref:hypothetical protein n=1 Tax=Bradyrhizobium sp. STM 3562 TaxID=578924 RepID=UPI00388EDD08
MIYAAITLAALGWIIGQHFWLKSIVGATISVLVATTIFAASNRYSLWDTAMVVAASQAILQGGYFLGLISRNVLSFGYRNLIYSSTQKPASASKQSDQKKRSKV